MSSDAQAEKETIETWKECWVQNTIPFHLLEIHPSLERHVKIFTKEKSNLTLFFPLCGKSVDMRWLAKQGHNIIGVEVADVAIKSFFEEAGLEYRESDIGGGNEGKKFVSMDGKFKLYQCDIFKYKSEFEGLVDGIWDRGSLEALNTDQRESYINLMLSLLKQDGVYLLHVFEYPNGAPEIGPHEIFQDDVVKMFGGTCDVDKLEDYMLSESQLEFHGIDKNTKMQGNLYKLTKK